MWSSISSDITITAIISTTTMKKLTNKQIPPIVRKFVNSLHSSFILAFFMLEPEKQIK